MRRIISLVSIAAVSITPLVTIAAVPGYTLVNGVCTVTRDSALFKDIVDCNTTLTNTNNEPLTIVAGTPDVTLHTRNTVLSRGYSYFDPLWNRFTDAFIYSPTPGQFDCGFSPYVQLLPFSATNTFSPDETISSVRSYLGASFHASYSGCMTYLGATSTAYTKNPNDAFVYGPSSILPPVTDTGGGTSLCITNCFSNIMFFPGIMGSKLYEQGTLEGSPIDIQRWSSGSDLDQARLSMNSNGYSVNNLYTKADTQGNTGITDEIGISGTALEGNIYKSFMDDLAQMKASSTVGIDYSLIPYDWRLPLSEIVGKGKVVDGKLYYGTTTTSLTESFIIGELDKLQKTSKSGKVTIVAHSNGGLVTKELIQTLKETNNPLYEKIDKVIFVGVPQVGTPGAVVGLLHGKAIGDMYLTSYLSNKRSRQLAQNMPMSYNLLPNQNYIDMVSQTDLNSKLVTFDGEVLADRISRYGYTIDGSGELNDFLTGGDGRINPAYNDTTLPNIGNATLLQNSIITHNRIDNFQPATSTKVIQIAGWGEDTIVGLDYKTYSTFLGTKYMSYKPRVAIDGDGTVVTPSALFMATSTPGVERWWVDLPEYYGILGQVNPLRKRHANLLEIENIRNFLKSKIIDTEFLDSERIVLQSQPTSSNTKRLRYTLHSPLTLGIFDEQGRYSGRATSTEEIINQIPGVRFDEVGEVQTISIPEGVAHTLYLDGQALGYFSLDIDKYQGNSITASTTFTGIPSTTNTIATIQMGSDANIASSTLKIDQDGNGTVDVTLNNNPSGYIIYDTTPPELRLTFSTSTKDVTLSAVDNLDTNPSINIGTSTITLKDSQNNTTIIPFTKFRDVNTKLVFTYNQITRNGVSTSTPNTRIEYDWKLDPQNQLKDLDTTVKIKGVDKYVFNYKKSNETIIKVKNPQTNQVTTSTRTGFVPVTVQTLNAPDLLDISY